MRFLSILCFVTVAFFSSCNNKSSNISGNNYYLDTDTAAVKTGGVKMVSINTPKGKFNVWTKKIGNNPKIKI